MHGVGRREGGAQLSLVRARADRRSEAAAAHPIAQQRRAQPDGRAAAPLSPGGAAAASAHCFRGRQTIGGGAPSTTSGSSAVGARRDGSGGVPVHELTRSTARFRTPGSPPPTSSK